MPTQSFAQTANFSSSRVHWAAIPGPAPADLKTSRIRNFALTAASLALARHRKYITNENNGGRIWAKTNLTFAADAAAQTPFPQDIAISADLK